MSFAATTTSLHLSLSVASSSPFRTPSNFRSLLTLSIHLCLGRSSGLFLFGFQLVTWPIVCSRLHHTCPAQLILLLFIVAIMSESSNMLFSFHYFFPHILPCFRFSWGQKFVVILIVLLRNNKYL